MKRVCTALAVCAGLAVSALAADEPVEKRLPRDNLMLFRGAEGQPREVRSLADWAKRRAEIVDLLAQGERSVEEVALELDQSVANTSHHLRALARAGLVATRRDGTRIHYRLASERVGELWGAVRDVAEVHVAASALPVDVTPVFRAILFHAKRGRRPSIAIVMKY